MISQCCTSFLILKEWLVLWIDLLIQFEKWEADACLLLKFSFLALRRHAELTSVTIPKEIMRWHCRFWCHRPSSRTASNPRPNILSSWYFCMCPTKDNKKDSKSAGRLACISPAGKEGPFGKPRRPIGRNSIVKRVSLCVCNLFGCRECKVTVIMTHRF